MARTSFAHSGQILELGFIRAALLLSTLFFGLPSLVLYANVLRLGDFYLVRSPRPTTARVC